MKNTKPDFGKLKELLFEQRASILEKFQRAKSDHAFDANDTPLDSVEEAAELFGKDMLANISDNWARELREIDNALVKMEKDDYGLCSDCGNGIGAARLKALPSASLCIDCQEKQDNAETTNARRNRQAQVKMIGGSFAAAVGT